MRTAVAGMVAALALGLGACGDDDDEGTPEGTGGATAPATTAAAEPLTREEYVKQANEICREATKAIDEVPAPKEGDLDSVAAALRGGEEVARKRNAELEALEPPPEIAEKVAEAERLSAQALDKITEGIEAAEAGDAERLNRVIQQIDDERLEQLAREVGVNDCAE